MLKQYNFVDILAKPKNGCPFGTYGCTGKACSNTKTCFCEQHCSWEKCRLLEKPDNCIAIMNSRWRWDSQKWHWVAQATGIQHHDCKNPTVLYNEDYKLLIIKFILYF